MAAGEGFKEQDLGTFSAGVGGVYVNLKLMEKRRN